MKCTTRWFDSYRGASPGFAYGIGLGVTLLLASIPARADDLPKRMAGQWESKITIDGRKPMTMQQCIDAKTDDMTKSMTGEQQQHCDKPQIRRSGNTWHFTTRCEFDGRKMLSEGEFTMKGDTAFSGTTTTRYEPPIQGKSTTRTSVETRRTGACAEGMKPGDIRMEGMPTFNPADMPRVPPGGRMSPEDAGKMREQAMKMLEEMKKSGKIPAR